MGIAIEMDHQDLCTRNFLQNYDPSFKDLIYEEFGLLMLAFFMTLRNGFSSIGNFESENSNVFILRLLKRSPGARPIFTISKLRFPILQLAGVVHSVHQFFFCSIV